METLKSATMSGSPGMEVAKTASEVVDVVRALPIDRRSIVLSRAVAEHLNPTQIPPRYAHQPADSHRIIPLTPTRSRISRTAR